MTFFRHFPTKDAVVLDDPYDPVIGEAISKQDASLPALDRVRLGILESWDALDPPDDDMTRTRIRLAAAHRSLRASIWQNNLRTEEIIVKALTSTGSTKLEARVAAGAVNGALTAALFDWAELRDARRPHSRCIGTAERPGCHCNGSAMTASPPPPLIAQGLIRRFDDQPAVDGLDLEVRPGEIHAVVGLNGAGKTTLMRLLLGMLKPNAGRAIVMGFDAGEAPSQVWTKVGHLIETPFAYPELTVAENIGAAALLHGLDRSEVRDAVQRAVDEFELGRWSGKRARSLSLGNRQRLGLASALVHRPRILILDEPGNGLDPAGVVLIRDMLEAYKTQGAAILASSHHLDELARIADRITVLHRGRDIGSLDPSGVDVEKRFFEIVYEADLVLRAGSA
jgi:ABC-2 type transport system ATP-binding protein